MEDLIDTLVDENGNTVSNIIEIVEDEAVEHIILAAISRVNNLPLSREASIVVTKLEEALLWYGHCGVQDIKFEKKPSLNLVK